MATASVLDQARWHSAWEQVGRPPPEGEFPALLARYAEAHRAYHNLTQLRECFAHFETAPGLAEQAGEILLAIWYHDAIYDACRGDNEERSADLADASLGAAGIDSASRQRINALILATKHHANPKTPDMEILIDLDLAILGAAPERFAEYQTQVRTEYRWVPGPLYRRKRRQFLRGMLARPVIYQTAHFRERLEKGARDNLSKAV